MGRVEPCVTTKGFIDDVGTCQRRGPLSYMNIYVLHMYVYMHAYVYKHLQDTVLNS